MCRRYLIIPFSIVIFSIAVCLFFLMKQETSDHKLAVKRKEVVRLIQEKKLIPDNFGRCILPQNYLNCSVNSKAYITIFKDGLGVLFPVSTGMKSNFSGYLYYDGTSLGHYDPLIEGRDMSIDLHSIDQVRLMDGTIYSVTVVKSIEQNWYKVYRDID